MKMDYTNRLYQDNTPESFHDFKPTHSKRPGYLIEAAEAVDNAWKIYDLVIEDELFASQYEYRKPRYEKVKAARERAEELGTVYSAQYNKWMKELRGE